MSGPSSIKTRGRRIVFLGSKAIGLGALEKIQKLDPGSLKAVITIDDRADGRGVLREFKKFCKKNGITLHIARGKKDSEQILRSIKPSVCFVVGWYWIISKEMLESVPLGFYGLHASLLPKYRGASPLVWAILNGERETGITLFRFSEGMDEGEIWGQKTVNVSSTDYIATVLKKVEAASLELLTENYFRIINRSGKPVRQNNKNATYCSQRRPEDGLIDWGGESRSIYDFIRAQSEPYPGAFTNLNGERLIIWRARLSKTTYYGIPGQIVKIDEAGAHIICGDNKPLIVEEVTFNNKRDKAKNIIKSIRQRLT